jgi:hypothetical protein
MPKVVKLPPHELIGHDTPLRLDVAAAIAFPGGAMTASGLLNEYMRGNLVVEKIANKYFTTLDAVAEMRKRCRQQASAPAPSTACPDEPPRPDSTCASDATDPPSGSSSTEAASLAQARLSMIAERLTTRSPRTLPKGASRNSAKVIRPTF